MEDCRRLRIRLFGVREVKYRKYQNLEKLKSFLGEERFHWLGLSENSYIQCWWQVIGNRVLPIVAKKLGQQAWNPIGLYGHRRVCYCNYYDEI